MTYFATDTDDGLLDSLSPYEVAIWAFTPADIDERHESRRDTPILLTAKESYIWAGAIAHALVRNPDLDEATIVRAFREALESELPLARRRVLGDLRSVPESGADGFRLVDRFLTNLGSPGELDVVISRTEEAARRLEQLRIIEDPLSKRVRNALIGVVLLFPVNFTARGPDGVKVEALTWEYVQRAHGDRTEREFRVKVREVSEAIENEIIPMWIDLTKRMTGEDVAMSLRDAQVHLKQLGYYAGPIDGVFGSRTRDALERFQRDHRLPETGTLDADTRARLARG